MPTAEDFRAPARSSPWLWRSARFTLDVGRGWTADPVRAWLRRPDALRVETLGGDLLQTGYAPPRRVAVPVLEAVDSRMDDGLFAAAG